jgi:MFS transporter, DHA1 family, inner membrane transport protein
VAARAPVGVLGALVFVRGADELGSFLPIGAFASLRADLGIDYADGGLVFVAFAVGGLASSPLGVLADHRSRRVLASLGALGYAASLAAFAVAPGLGVILGAALLLGASSDVMVHACEAALVDVAGARLERELSRLNLVAAVGDLVGPGAFVVVGAVGGSWRLVLALGALAMLAYAAWLAAVPFPSPAAAGDDDDGADGDERQGAEGDGDEARTPWRDVAGLLRDPGVWWLAVVSALFGSLDEAYFGFLLAFLTDRRGFADATATLAASGLVVGGLVGYAVLVRRPPGRRAMPVAAAAMVVASLAIAAVPWPAAVGAASTAFGAAVAVFWVAFQARTLRHRPDRAASVATVVGVLEQPGVVVPVLVGVVADQLGLHAAMVVYVAVPTALLALTVVTTAPRGARTCRRGP